MKTCGYSLGYLRSLKINLQADLPLKSGFAQYTKFQTKKQVNSGVRT